MDILSIYKELSSLQMTEDNMKGLAKGYQTYCALKAKGWVQTPCRLVYRKPKTVSMVVLPFYIPKLKDLIWGIEAEGTYLALEAQQAKELYPGFIVAKMYGDSSVFWGDFMQATKRPFGLPTTEEFHRWHQMNGIVAQTLVEVTHRSKTFEAGQFPSNPPPLCCFIYMKLNSENKRED